MSKRKPRKRSRPKQHRMLTQLLATSKKVETVDNAVDVEAKAVADNAVENTVATTIASRETATTANSKRTTTDLSSSRISSSRSHADQLVSTVADNVAVNAAVNVEVAAENSEAEVTDRIVVAVV